MHSHEQVVSAGNSAEAVSWWWRRLLEDKIKIRKNNIEWICALTRYWPLTYNLIFSHLTFWMDCGDEAHHQSSTITSRWQRCHVWRIYDIVPHLILITLTHLLILFFGRTGQWMRIRCGSSGRGRSGPTWSCQYDISTYNTKLNFLRST